MDSFTIQGEANFITVTFDEVYGFPGSTCHWGGYEVRAILKIKSGGFEVTSILWTSTGEIYEFFQQLKRCNNKLTGEANYKSYEGDFELSAAYDTMGHADIKGRFSEQSEFNNELQFEFISDQSFISTTIRELELISGKYGGMEGVKS